MVAPSRPTSLATNGKRNWIFVPTIANVAAPTALEVNAASALDITNIIFGSSGKPAQSTNRVTAERRMGDTNQFEQLGYTTFTGADMTYQFNAQAAAASAGKVAWEKFLGGTSGFFVERLGLVNSTTPAAAQFVNVFPVTLGPSMVTEQGDGETAEAAAMCTYAITSQPTFNVALV